MVALEAIVAFGPRVTAGLAPISHVRRGHAKLRVRLVVILSRGRRNSGVGVGAGGVEVEQTDAVLSLEVVVRSEVVVVARRQWGVVARLVGLALVVRVNFLADVAMARGEKLNSLAFQAVVTRRSLLHSSASLALLTRVVFRLDAAADLRPTRGIHPLPFACQAVVAGRSFFNGPAALVFSTRLLVVVNTGSG